MLFIIDKNVPKFINYILSNLNKQMQLSLYKPIHMRFQIHHYRFSTLHDSRTPVCSRHVPYTLAELLVDNKTASHAPLA